MNANKSKAPAKTPYVPPSNNVRPPANGYVPKYQPPPEPPAPPPAPIVENNVEIPSALEITTISDLVERIEANASILFPATERLKVTTALVPSGLLCHALLVAPKNEESSTSRYKVVLKGPGVPGTKGHESKGRRAALEGLLEEVERRVGKELCA